MFKSLLGLGEDVLKIATAPVEIAVDLTRTVTKPVADAAQDVVKEIKSDVDEFTNE